MEENNDDSVEEEEEPEDEQEKEEVSSSLEEEGEVEDGKTDYDLWCPLLGQVGPDLKELYMKEVQQFLAGGESQTYPGHAAFNALLPVCRGRLHRT